MKNNINKYHNIQVLTSIERKEQKQRNDEGVKKNKCTYGIAYNGAYYKLSIAVPP